MEYIKWINFGISLVFTVFYAHQLFYIIVPFIFKNRESVTIKPNKIAVIISARNEERVIGNLIDSIKHQDYPSELITTFVVADNCTDKTAQISKDLGAVVYERFNKSRVGKGYALQYLFDKIRKDYGLDKFDGYLVLDADNLIMKGYITEINKVLSAGYNIVTSYRNSKNYGDNWISAGYALWFLRESKFLNHSRMLLGTSCAVSGTGFIMSREIVEKNNGWQFFSLTEDIEFSVKSIIDGEKIGYAAGAELFDEQPTKFSQSWNQRLRWSKGFYQVFGKFSPKLFKGILKGSFACYDMMTVIMPALVLSVLGIISNLISLILNTYSYSAFMAAFLIFLRLSLSAYFMLFAVGLITTVSEWKKIHTNISKKLMAVVTFPFFMLTYIPLSCIALFKRVEWKPIIHSKNKTVEDVLSL